MSGLEILEGVLESIDGAEAGTPLWVDATMRADGELLAEAQRFDDAVLVLDDATRVKVSVSDPVLAPRRSIEDARVR